MTLAIGRGGEPVARAQPVTEKPQSLYERDFALWLEQQAELLREGRLSALDAANSSKRSNREAARTRRQSRAILSW
jgi:hypothetical protein